MAEIEKLKGDESMTDNRDFLCAETPDTNLKDSQLVESLCYVLGLLHIFLTHTCIFLALNPRAWSSRSREKSLTLRTLVPFLLQFIHFYIHVPSFVHSSEVWPCPESYHKGH